MKIITEDGEYDGEVESIEDYLIKEDEIYTQTEDPDKACDLVGRLRGKYLLIKIE